jgi:hypothetical protein
MNEIFFQKKCYQGPLVSFIEAELLGRFNASIIRFDRVGKNGLRGNT